MPKLHHLFTLTLAAALVVASAVAQPGTGTLRGTMTDDSGGVIPAANVTLTGKGVNRTAQTQVDGSYVFQGLAPGQYNVVVSFPGFAPINKPVNVAAGGNVVVPIQMVVAASKQEITVADQSTTALSVEPDNNATALVLRGEDLAALPDDPDDLSDALQALAGPGAGPNGGPSTSMASAAASFPPKESIREIRINQNPFSAEYDKLGFGRIEILTKPGTDKIRGSLGFNDSEGALNSRNPVSTNKPDFSSRMFTGNIGGPLGKRASFFFDFNRRQITDNALVNAVFVRSRIPSCNRTFRRRSSLPTHAPPWRRAHRLPAIHQQHPGGALRVQLELAREPGRRRLPPARALRGHGLQLHRQQSEPDAHRNLGGQSRDRERDAIPIHTHLLEPDRQPSAAGQRVRRIHQRRRQRRYQHRYPSALRIAEQHFHLPQHPHVPLRRPGAPREATRTCLPAASAAYSPFWADPPRSLDANNNIVTDASGNPVLTTLSAVDQYSRTLMLQKAGFTPAQIRQLGGGASQFSIDTGNPYSSIVQYDVGAFAQDDWRLRPNLTVSYGLRYEWQTNIDEHHDFAPRLGFAWAPGTSKNGRQKTVVRGGFGIFYDRVSGSADRARPAAQRRQPAFLYRHQSRHVPQRSLARQPQPLAEQHLSPRSEPALRLPRCSRPSAWSGSCRATPPWR